MQSRTFKNFQVGIVDDPSVEAQGGFEFASGMDIFTEPGVIKATFAMEEVAYGSGAMPTSLPLWMVDTVDGSGQIRAYIAAGAKLLESSNGGTFNLFRTNTQGANIGLNVWAGYVVYISATKIGRTLVGDASGADDSYITTLDTDSEVHPTAVQGGTLKIGAGRYVASLDESFALTARAMKLPMNLRVRSLAEHLTNLYCGVRLGAAIGGAGASESSVFGWRGTVLSSGSALPDNVYQMKLRDMNALLSDGRSLLGFPDSQGDILRFDGVGFPQYRKLNVINQAGVGSFQINPGAVTQHLDNTILVGGQSSLLPGIFQMRDGAMCQAFVPSTAVPGVNASFNVGFVKSSFNGIVYIGYFRTGDNSYHVERSTSNRQNNAIVRTLWHCVQTDRLKRWYGVKLNLKPLAASTSVAVAYRTSRDAAFTDSGYTITSANQHLPVILPVQPRSREIQFKFTYTTATTNTPELLSYDPLYEVLNAIR